MSKTAIQLIQEVAKRTRQYAAITTSSGGTTTTMIAAALAQQWPNDVSSINAWVYGTPSATESGNRGFERRATSWSATSLTLTFPSGAAWPSAIGSGSSGYDVYLRDSHDEILSAINDAVGMLEMGWYRPVYDNTSIITVDNTWRYTLPSGVNWKQITDVQLQVNTNADLTGYPYEAAPGYRIHRTVDSSGTETWYLQFNSMPPVGRYIRFFAEAGYLELTTDSSVLPISGAYERRCLMWIADYAKYVLSEAQMFESPSGDTQEARQAWLDSLMRAKEQLQAAGLSHRPSRIVVPGQGDIHSPRGHQYVGIFAQSH